MSMSIEKKRVRSPHMAYGLDSRLMCSSMTLRRESRISVCVCLYSELLLIARRDRHADVWRNIFSLT